MSVTKREAQIKNAQRITVVFLEKLGFTEKDNLLEIHSIFINKRPFDRKIYEVKDIINWAVKIYEANKKVKLFHDAVYLDFNTIDNCEDRDYTES
jgi:hypothetical protein